MRIKKILVALILGMLMLQGACTKNLADVVDDILTSEPTTPEEKERAEMLAKGSRYLAELSADDVKEFQPKNQEVLWQRIKQLVFNDITCYNDANTYTLPCLGVFYEEEEDIITPSQIMEAYPEGGRVQVADTPNAVQRYKNGTLVYYEATVVHEDNRIIYYYRTGDASVFWNESGRQNGDGAIDWAVVNKIADVSKKLELSRQTEVEKIKRVHDYLISSIDYDFSEEKGNRRHVINGQHTAYAALIDQSCVCDGYAKAFRLFMIYNGIECVNVTGKSQNGVGHEWNQVCLGDKWYHVDCTWDDPTVNGSDGGRILYNYFMVPDAGISKDHFYEKSDNYNVCEDKAFMYYAFDEKIIESKSDIKNVISKQKNCDYIYLLYDDGIDEKLIMEAVYDIWKANKVCYSSERYMDYNYLVVWRD